MWLALSKLPQTPPLLIHRASRPDSFHLAWEVYANFDLKTINCYNLDCDKSIEHFAPGTIGSCLVQRRLKQPVIQEAFLGLIPPRTGHLGQVSANWLTLETVRKTWKDKENSATRAPVWHVLWRSLMPFDRVQHIAEVSDSRGWFFIWTGLKCAIPGEK